MSINNRLDRKPNLKSERFLITDGPVTNLLLFIFIFSLLSLYGRKPFIICKLFTNALVNV